MPEYHGLLVIDKPGGITSRDAVNRAQGWFPRRTRIGHTGTLDPLATGVLVLCIGQATRLADHVQRLPKTYTARFRLGANSDSDDADGTIEEVADAVPPSPADVRAGLDGFLGEIEQTPPAYSAAKQQGRRAYTLARRGQEVALAPRRVHVYSIDIIDFAYPRLDVVVHCGKGTYIRSLARDLGAKLGCGAYVEELRRTKVGPFDVEDAIDMDADRQTALGRLLPLKAAVADLPTMTLAQEELTRLCQGQAMPTSIEAEEEVAVLDEAGEFAALAIVQEGLLRPSKVFRIRGLPGSTT